MDQLLSLEELDNILAQLSSYTEVSITDITPKEIEHLENEEQKQQYQSDFEKINELYVKPLENTLNYLINQKNKTHYVFSYDEFSIKQRLRMIEKSLLQFGLTYEQIVNLVPKTMEEINILVNAIERGYTTTKIVNNDYRVEEAKIFLNDKILSENTRVM